MSLSEPATFWGKYVKVVSGVQLILFWSYSRFGSIVLSWTYHGLSNLATLLAHWITTKNTSQIASNCRNQHQPTHTHTHIYPWIARNLLCYNFYQIFSTKKWAKHRRCFQISPERPGHGVPNVPHAERKARRDNKWHTSPGGGKIHHFLLGTPLVNLDFAKWYRCPIWCSYTIWNGDFPWQCWLSGRGMLFICLIPWLKRGLTHSWDHTMVLNIRGWDYRLFTYILYMYIHICSPLIPRRIWCTSLLNSAGYIPNQLPSQTGSTRFTRYTQSYLQYSQLYLIYTIVDF